ncbi:MAG: hypothetical protein OD815_000744 [Candidatus Alkanophagales archaeon MCA70_species_2]|nr:hypothetical protein [Candidatus Alkanophaga liquidiphilum]RLG38143.1 MAG: hypothetical protein DRN91_03510 [Candidatus Alkanophagales archaeon]
MLSMGELLRSISEVLSGGEAVIKRDIAKLTGWEVSLVLVKELGGIYEGTKLVKILFTNDFLIDARLHDNAMLRRLGEDCDLFFRKTLNVRSKVRYDVTQHRIWVEFPEDALTRMVFEKIYVPLLRRAYKAVMSELRGFHRRDYFGIEVSPELASAYYSQVRLDKEEARTSVNAVVRRLNDIEESINSWEVRQFLKDADSGLEQRLRTLCRSV